VEKREKSIKLLLTKEKRDLERIDIRRRNKLLQAG
jgi:hypothetical protein